MEIKYKDAKLEALVKDTKALIRFLGPRRAKILQRRLDDLKNVSDKKDLALLPGRYHALIGDRQGEWACSLDQPYRLIFIIEGTKIIIQEIVDYHG